MSDEDVTQCGECGEPAVVGINGVGACDAHVDDVMRRTLIPIRDEYRRARDG